MQRLWQQSRMAMTGLLILSLGWIFVGLFLASKMNLLYPAAWWVKAAAFCCFIFPPIALLFALSGLWLDERKAAAVLAVVLSALSGIAVFVIRP